MTSANLIHHVPGRMRLRVHSAKGDSNRLRAIREKLLELPSVRQVTPNPTLGTLLIEYDPTVHEDFTDSLTEYALDRHLFELMSIFPSNPEETISTTDRSIDRLVDNTNRAIQALTHNTLNLKELFPFSLLLYALFLVDRAASSAQWLSWMQFAFSSYMELHDAEPVAKVGQSVEALRADILALHADVRALASRMGA